MAKVSIIIPIFGIKKIFLENCIESLLNQTLEDIEIILVDDGNKNEISSICDEFALKDERIKVIHQENQGVSIARNKGIEFAHSEFIAFVDADDWVEKITFEKAYNVAVEKKCDVVIWEHKVEKENSMLVDKPIIKNNEFNISLFNIQEDLELFQRSMFCSKAQFLKGMHGAPWGKLYKREYLLKYKLTFKKELIRSQDNEFNFRVFENINSIAYINGEFYHYREGRDSAMRKYRINSKEIQKKYLEELYSNIVKFKKSKVFYEDFDIVVINKFSDICVTNYTHIENPDNFNDKIDGIRKLSNESPFKSSFLRVNHKEFKKNMKVVVPMVQKKQYTFVYLLFKFRYTLKKMFMYI